MRTAVLILIRLIGKALLPIERGTLVKIRQRHIGTEAGVLQGDDILDRAIRRVPTGEVELQMPAETDMPEEVQHGLVVHHLRGRD